MGVPRVGEYDMYTASADDERSIAGGIDQGGDDPSGLDQFTELINESNINYFDPAFSGGATALSQISESIQYRNYPLTPPPNTPAPTTLAPTDSPTPAPVNSLDCVNYDVIDRTGLGGTVRYQPCSTTDGSFIHQNIDKYGTSNFCARRDTVEYTPSELLTDISQCDEYTVNNFSLDTILEIQFTNCETGESDTTFIAPNSTSKICSTSLPTSLTENIPNNIEKTGICPGKNVFQCRRYGVRNGNTEEIIVRSIRYVDCNGEYQVASIDNSREGFREVDICVKLDTNGDPILLDPPPILTVSSQGYCFNLGDEADRCVLFDASFGFNTADDDNDCNKSLTGGDLYLNMYEKTRPLAGQKVFNGSECGNVINAPNTYYVISHSTYGKWRIKVGDDGCTIVESFECTTTSKTLGDNIQIVEVGACPPINQITPPATQPPTNPPTFPPTTPPTPPPTPAPTPAPTSANIDYSCDDGFRLFTTSSAGAVTYPTVDLPSDDPTYNNIIHIHPDARPNKVVISDSSGDVFDSGWVGYANYSGPWGSSLNKPGNVISTYTYGSTSNRQMVVQGGAADPNNYTTDIANIKIECGTETEYHAIDVCIGSTIAAACDSECINTTLYFDNSDWQSATKVSYNDPSGGNAIYPQPNTFIAKDGNFQEWDGSNFTNYSGSCSAPPPTDPPTPQPTPAPTGTTIYKYKVEGCRGEGNYNVQTNTSNPGPYSVGDVVRFPGFGGDICGTILSTTEDFAPFNITATVNDCGDPLCFGFDCDEYRIELIFGNTAVDFSYVDCEGNSQTGTVGGSEPSVKTQCLRSINSSQDGRLSIYQTGKCSGGDTGFPPTLAPTSEPTPAPAPTSPTVPTPAPTVTDATYTELGTSQDDPSEACADHSNYTNFNGWIFRAEDSTIQNGWPVNDDTSAIGFHRGTILSTTSCIRIFEPYGTGVNPTDTLVNLVGTDCGTYTDDFGNTQYAQFGQGIQGYGNVSSYLLTQFVQIKGSFFMAISNSSGTDPGVTTFTNKIIKGSDGSEGIWSVTLDDALSYTDDDGSGTTRTPERSGYLTLSGITLKIGVTYILLTD